MGDPGEATLLRVLEALESIGWRCATARELAEATGLSRSTVITALRALEEMGVVAAYKLVPARGAPPRHRPPHLYCVRR